MGLIMAKTATVGNILETNRTSKMRDLPILAKALKFYGTITMIRSNSTAEETLISLRRNDPEILKKTIHELLNPKSTVSEICYNIKSILMWLMLMLMAGAYTASSIYIALETKTTIPWEDMFLPLIGPILLVLHERGVVSKENRDALTAISGVHPALTLMESLSQRIANGPRRTTAKTESVIEPDVKNKKVEEDDY